MSRDWLLQRLSALSTQTLPLLILTGVTGSGKTALIQDLAQTQQKPVFSLNLLLAEALLPLSDNERPHAVKPWLDRFLAGQPPGVCFFDPCEILWEPTLLLQPLVLLKQASGVRPLVVTLCGELNQGNLIIARPGHPEYGILKVNHLALVNMPGEELCNG